MNPIIKAADAQTFENLQKIDVDAFARVNDDIANAIRMGLENIVMTGGLVKDAVILVADNADDLARYAGTWINTSRSMLSQQITDITAQHYKEAGGKIYYQYRGAILDSKTRKICRQALGAMSSSYPNAPYFTPEEKSSFMSRYGIRWNCRHQFTLITEKHYNKMVG